MSYKRCCIPGCSGTAENILHEFPNPAKDLDRFMAWIYNVGGDILKLTNTFIFKNRRVCHMHFEAKYHCRYNRLSNIAVPSLNMPCLNSTTSKLQNLLEDLPAVSSLSTEQSTLRQIQNLPMNRSSCLATSDNLSIEIEVSKQCELLIQEKENIAPSSKHSLAHKSATDIKQEIYRNQQKADTNRRNTKIKVITHSVKLTKPEQNLYKKLVSVKRKNSKYKNKLTKQTIELKLAKTITSNPEFLKVMENLPSAAKILMMMQFREQGKNMKGRRFDIKEKITSLSLLKQSPRAYKFLRKFLVLPAPQTLMKLLTRANIKPGINKNIFVQLKSKSAEMKSDEKLCILMFDEMALKMNVTYNERKDCVTGFVNTGKQTQPILANHAQVFMIRGLQKNYKQPVLYTFSSGATKGSELARQVKELIISLQEAGFTVVATVCDQGTNNRQAIKNLLDETRADYLRRGETPRDKVFVVNGEEIVPLYDPPHLLKGIRNNLLMKNLEYELNGEIKVAKWQHLVLLHKENPGYKGVRLVPKLTENHIVPQKIGKMKVKYASQVFSATVASNMGYLADKKILSEECKGTADILLFFDNLFDSVNGSFTKKKRFAKPLLGPATPSSVHHEKWREAKKILKSMKFMDKAGKKVPTINNWVWTLEGIEVLLKNLETKFNITSVWMRHLNQDPIENFFGAIRSHGCRNTNPTPERFVSVFTTLLVNSLTSVHTPGGNCEHDLGEALITLIVADCEADDDSTCAPTLDDILSIELEPMEKKSDPRILAPLQYVTGYFIKKTKKIYKSCKTCEKELVSSKETEYIKYREYADRHWLCSPTHSIVNIISNVQDIAMSILKKDLEKKNLKLYIKTIVYTLVDLKHISCPNHKDKLINFLINAVCRFFIYNYCKIINKILYGRKDVDDTNDKFQIMAKIYFQKCLKIKNKYTNILN